MSVTAYPMTSTGFIIDEEAAAYINLAYNEKHNSVPDDIQKMLYDNRFNDLAKKENCHMNTAISPMRMK